jgi:hypothetical protein
MEPPDDGAQPSGTRARSSAGCVRQHGGASVVEVTKTRGKLIQRYGFCRMGKSYLRLEEAACVPHPRGRLWHAGL